MIGGGDGMNNEECEMDNEGILSILNLLERANNTSLLIRSGYEGQIKVE